MASRQRKRKLSRKEQSLRDKERTLMNDSTFYQPLKEYNHFLAHLRNHGYAHNEFTSIPFNLIDLASALIAAMITGRDLTLFRNTPPEPAANDDASTDNDTEYHKPSYYNHSHHQDTLDREETETFYFIHRILKRTQLSCTTLILALIYIDRIKARLTNTLLKKRTRLDQGPEYERSPYTFQSNTRGHSRSHSNTSSSNDLAYVTTTPSSSSSSTTSSSSTSPPNFDEHSPHQTSFPASNTRHGLGNKCGTETSWSSISLFLVAVICADKYLFDATFTNGEWADFTRGMYTTAEINELERRFLGRLQYKLYVSEPEFDGFLSYLEVILQLQQVWGRGFRVGLSYSDVRILTQQLMPAYAGRLQFRTTLQHDVAMVLWQVTVVISRVYLAIVGTVMVAAASYAALVEMTMLSTRVAWNSMETHGYCPTTLMGLHHHPSNTVHTWNELFLPMLQHYQHFSQAQFGSGAFHGSDAFNTLSTVPSPNSVFHDSISPSVSDDVTVSVMNWLGDHTSGTLVHYEGSS